VLSHPEELRVNVPPPEDNEWKEFLDFTTIEDHNTYYFELHQVPSNFFDRFGDEGLTIRVYDDGLKPSLESARKGSEQTRLTIVKEPTLIAKRFYPINLMHIFHDDWLGYFDVREYWGHDKMDNARFVNFDHYIPSNHDSIYDWFGPRMQRIEYIMGWPHWVSNNTVRRDEYVCFQDAIIGNSKENTWYQYGYFEPQGPLKNYTANGYRLRDITKTILSHLELHKWDHLESVKILKFLSNIRKRSSYDSAEMFDTINNIAIFSRRQNRIIMNEEALAKRLEREFRMPVKFVRMENMTLAEIVKILRTTSIAFGMHGALLTMTMFMPPGSILIEGFPYAIPAENYTPYKTMVELPGMFMTYKAWTCTNEEDSMAYPNRVAGYGGIAHLPISEQEAIKQSNTIPIHLCCSNPYWLYRIFQDTRINLDEVVSLIWDAVGETLEKLPKAWK
jgi:protein O-mannose beta-1,4-N-acetylglucosaminyltransferase